VVFLDSDWRDYPGYVSHLVRLTRVGSVVVSANLSPLFGRWGKGLPGKNAIRAYLRSLILDARFRTYITRGDWHAISVRI
jgi:predicted O-methyltransferase YrrM